MSKSNSSVFNQFLISKSEAKAEINEYMCNNPNSSFHYNEYTGVTVLVTQEFNGANVMRVSTAVMSPDEIKFRKTLGKFICVNNMNIGAYINIPTSSVLDFINNVVNPD